MIAPPLRRRSRISHFKTPFIVSIAMPTAFGVACGGQAEVSEQEHGTREETGDSANTDAGASAPILPTAERTCGPRPGPPLQGGFTCAPTAFPTCQDGVWVFPAAAVGVACNPPFFDYACPTDEPVGGTACAGYAPGLTCEYAYCYGLTPTVRCSEGRWESLPLPSCNPPPPEPECPSAAPALGADCHYEGQSCAYAVCGDPNNPNPYRTCIAGVWQSGELPCPPGEVDAGASDAGH
jgi:hypothetical protein